ncbi:MULTISPECIES: ArgP/LysG family DNA-binding transcriptional regulator [Arsenicicoccus]|uniref:ArgP/LysG family DNA-binding transcriptional regulator n=1 Tax=Arsenicicoccus TaxID=267408 RepID=UPI00257B2F05|nr:MULTISPECIES: ArgP/LysG family DNA-binding transcriptional regulator [Arsenicicoccus]
MHADSHQLAALLAVVDEGSFEAAADELRVTPSAVSQRIKALERRVGQVVVQRTRPCRPTSTGEVLVRMARQLALLEAEAGAALTAQSTATTIAIALNADSLATWARDVLVEAAEAGDIGLELHVEDQDHSLELLRAGRVLAALTADPVAVQGCSVTELLPMRYVPVATRWLWERHERDLSRMPVVRFNDKDYLQDGVLRELGVTATGLVHTVPSTEDFAMAVRCGLGWGALPVAQLGRRDDLVEVAPGHDVLVPLYWQRWRIDSAVLDRVTEWVVSASRTPTPTPAPPRS